MWLILSTSPTFSNNSNRITTADDGGDTLCGCKLSQLLSNRLKENIIVLKQ
jgi:hypothetical protein